MKTVSEKLKTRTAIIAFILCGGWCATASLAQGVMDSSVKGTGEGEVIKLSPFTVNAEEDKGYLAGSSLAGSRTATNLKDLASPVTVFTEQFLADTGVTDTVELSQFMLSTERDLGEVAGPQNAITTDDNAIFRVRGFLGGATTVNFFRVGMRFDTFSMERVDQSRGPNSILFGIGTPGGLLNVTTKQPVLNRNFARLAFTARSWDGFREELDYNQVLIDQKVAVRLAAVHSEKDSWRNWEYDKHQRIFGALKWQIDSLTQFNAEVENGHVNKATKRTYTAFDGYTTWAQAGRQLSNSANAALGIQSLGGANYTVYDTATGTLQNWVGKTSSARRVSDEGQPIALTDFGLLPKETVVYGPGNDQITDYTRITTSLTRRFFDSVSLELAAFQLRQHRVVYDPNPNASLYLLADTNATLPDGSANPNAGRAYLETQPFIKDTFLPSNAARVSLSYDFDLGKMGNHRLAAVMQRDKSEFGNVTSGERILMNPFSTARPEINQNIVRRRTYVDLDGPSRNIVMADWRNGPINGLPVVGNTAARSRSSITTGFVPFNVATQINTDTTNTVTAMLQSKFFNNRLHTVIGASRDRQKSFGSSLARKPSDGVFNEGVYYAVRNTSPDYFKTSNVSFNGVYHITDWVSAAYNQSSNSSLPGNGILDSANGRPPTPKGKSKDYGLRFDLLDGRLYFTATYFETSATKNAAFNGVRGGDINHIWNALDTAGVLSANGLLLDNVLNRTTVTTFDSESKGWEFEVIANLTDNLRLFANYSDSEVRQTNIGEEMRAYIAANRAFWEANGSAVLDSQIGSATTVAEYLPVLDNLVVTEMDLPDGGLQRGQAPRKGNLRASYDFTAGRLAGLTLGGGARYLGRAVTSYSAAVDPVTNAFLKTAYYRKSQTYLDINLGFKNDFRIAGKKLTWSLRLNINNVLNKDDIIPLITTTTNEIVTYAFPTPREYVFSANVRF